MVYRYYIWEDYDDLMQHGLNSCYTNFVKFDQSKGTAFNYFSIIAKISLLNYTDRKKKHRNHDDIEDYNTVLKSREVANYELFFDDLEDTLFGIIDGNYIGKKRIEYTRIASVIIDYLRKTKKFVSKSDLYAWGRSLGIKNNQIREFVKEMSNHNTEIFEGI
jgi:DNA-directed RNA polymerase specialized sigma subunit